MVMYLNYHECTNFINMKLIFMSRFVDKEAELYPDLCDIRLQATYI